MPAMSKRDYYTEIEETSSFGLGWQKQDLENNGKIYG